MTKTYPRVSFALFVSSCVFYLLAEQYPTIWAWPSGSFTGLTVLFFLHPIIHASWGHLLGNAPFLIAGPLIESWMIFSRNTRYGILSLCHLVSLDISFLGWVAMTSTHRPAYGLSTMISSALAFAIVYCWIFRRQIRFKGWNLLAFAIGILLMIIVWNTLYAVTGFLSGYLSVDYPYPVFYHWFAFVQALVLGLVLLPRFRKGIAQIQYR